MYANEVIALVRANLNDTSNAPGQRYSDTTLLTWYNQAQRRLMRDVLFPSGRMPITTVPNQQEYQVGTVLQTDSVYLNGQLLVPVDSIATLEGHQIQFYDQGSLGGNPAPTPGSGLPSSTLGPWAPSWGTVTPQGYPAANYGSWPAPDAGPGSPIGGSQRGRYYYRAGYIGVTPAPSVGPPLDANGNPIPNLIIDGVFFPPNAGSVNDPSIFPEYFAEALAWKVCEFARFADDSQLSKESRTYSQSSYREAMLDIRMTIATFKGDSAGGPKVQTSRAFYSRGGVRSVRSHGYP